jgi:hypothetical protein
VKENPRVKIKEIDGRWFVTTINAIGEIKWNKNKCFKTKFFAHRYFWKQTKKMNEAEWYARADEILKAAYGL